VRLVPADSLAVQGLVDLFNAAYADYAVPLRLDVAGLEFTLGVSDVDLAASRVALRSGHPAAFAFLALRGSEAWIGGMGTVPAQRRGGLGEAVLGAVLESARARGVEAVRLEVIEGNTPARRLYDKLRFERTRDLGVWTLDGAPPRVTKAEPATVGAAQTWIRAHRGSQEPWQRADETVEHMVARGVELDALAFERDGETAGAALYQHGAGLPRVVQLEALDVEAATHLLAAVAARGDGFRFVNAPEDGPVTAAMTRLQARLELRQHEMRLSL
jgi:GNAT superfamily N-acetyltransferase